MAQRTVHVGLVENDAAYQEEIKTALGGLDEIKRIYAWESAEAFWRDPKGKTIARVADILQCSPHTVNDHAKSIYRKLNVHNRSELAQKAAAAGLLPS